MYRFKYLFSSVFVLCFLACFQDDQDVAGSTLETENSIALLATLPDGNPVKNARVYLHKSDYLKTDNFDSSLETPETDKEGLLPLDSLKPGSYIAEVRSELNDNELKGALSFVIPDSVSDSSIVFLVEIDKALEFNGTVETNATNAWVMIRGLEYAVPVDSNGNYSFESLPAGEYDFVLVYQNSENDFSVVTSEKQCIGCGSLAIPLIDTLSKNLMDSIIIPTDTIDTIPMDTIPTDTIPMDTVPEVVDTLKHFMFEDFENGTDAWYISHSDYSSGTLESITNSADREGTFAHFTSVNDSLYNWVLMGKYLGGAVDLSELDSVVFYAKGTVDNYISFSFDIVKGANADDSSGKSWVHITLDSVWNRYTVKPSDLLEIDSIGGNIGWDNVKNNVTNISIFGGKTGEFWIDDIEIFGYDSLVIKE